MKTLLFSLLGIFLFSNFTKKTEKKACFFDYAYTYQYADSEIKTTILLNSNDSTYFMTVNTNFAPYDAILRSPNTDEYYTFLYEKPMKFHFLNKQKWDNSLRKKSKYDKRFIKLDDTINASLSLECYYVKKKSNKLYATVTANYDKSDFKFNTSVLNYLTHGLTECSKMKFTHNGVPTKIGYNFLKGGTVTCFLINKQKIQQTITIE